MKWLAEERGIDLGDDHDALWRWSVSGLEAFWNSVFDYFGVSYDGGREPALTLT